MSNCKFAQTLAKHTLVEQEFLHCQKHIFVIYELVTFHTTERPWTA